MKYYFNPSVVELLVNSLITSRLNYCNSPLYGISQNQLDKLQRAQNAAARLLSQTSKYEHVTPVLMKLHWLTIKQRFNYKLLTIVFKALQSTAPPYIQFLITQHVPARSLRSAHLLQLHVPKTAKTIGDTAFEKSGPVLWISLPNEIRNCQTRNLLIRYWSDVSEGNS